MAEKAIFCIKIIGALQEAFQGERGEWMSVRVQFTAEHSSSVYWQIDQYQCQDELCVISLLSPIQSGSYAHGHGNPNGGTEKTMVL